jgi:hypothetical protein
MLYLKIENNLITEMLCGRIDNPDDHTIVPDSFQGSVGQDIRWFDENYSFKTIKQRIDEGTLTLDSTQKLEGDNTIVNKTNEELIQEGLLTPPEGFKVVEYQIVPKTLEDKLADNDITQESYFILKMDECLTSRKRAYEATSDGIFFDYQRGEIDKQMWLDAVAEIKARYPKPEVLNG